MTRQPLGHHGPTHLPDGEDPIPGLNVWRISFGQVSGPGGVATIYDPGSGDWTVSGDGFAVYTVTFNVPFSAKPTVLVSENESTSFPPQFASLTDVSLAFDYFTVVTYDLAGAETDDVGFNFIAIGT